MPKSMDQYNWKVGTYFTEKKEFTCHSNVWLANGKNLKFDKNDKKRDIVVRPDKFK